jgi:hypothetical protein
VAHFDIRIISAIFQGEVITARFGKLYVIDPVFSIDYGWLGALFLSHYYLAVKGFFLEPSFPGRAPARMGLNELVGAGAPCF